MSPLPEGGPAPSAAPLLLRLLGLRPRLVVDVVVAVAEWSLG